MSLRILAYVLTFSSVCPHALKHMSSCLNSYDLLCSNMCAYACTFTSDARQYLMIINSEYTDTVAGTNFYCVGLNEWTLQDLVVTTCYHLQRCVVRRYASCASVDFNIWYLGQWWKVLQRDYYIATMCPHVEMHVSSCVLTFKCMSPHDCNHVSSRWNACLLIFV